MAQNVISTNNIVVANGGTGNTSTTAYSLICGGTTTTGAYQAVADVAAGQVLVSGGTGALPAFSATPTLTSITFGAGTALGTYAEGTWTPTADGSTPGSTTYTAQNGYYVRIGNLVWVCARIVITAMTGTGTLQLGGLPFTVKNVATEVPEGTICIDFGTTYTWASNTTTCTVEAQPNTTYCLINTFGNAVANSNLAPASLSGKFRYTIVYQI